MTSGLVSRGSELRQPFQSCSKHKQTIASAQSGNLLLTGVFRSWSKCGQFEPRREGGAPTAPVTVMEAAALRWNTPGLLEGITSPAAAGGVGSVTGGFSSGRVATVNSFAIEQR